MFRADSPAGLFFRGVRTHVRALAASAGILGLTLGILVSLHHGPYAIALDSGPLAANVVRSATDMNWRKSPAASLSSPGRNTVSVDACPAGVIANEPAYYVYISGAGKPEAVQVSGGTCKGDGHPGTLEFTTANPHPPGYVLGSASSGIQEASIAARFTPSSPRPLVQSGRVVIPPGEYEVFAPISIRASNQTIDFGGSVLNCYTPNDPCILVGDQKRSSLFANITLSGPRGRPMMVAGTKPFIEVNANQTRILNLSMSWPPPGGTFGTYVQVDDDEAFLLDGLDTTLGGGGVTCNPTYCGAVITAPGPFKPWAAVGWLKNLNMSLQCAGKGIEWVSGNSVRISDSVIQGWSVFGVRVSNQRGGYAGLITENVYFEAAPNCTQYTPYGNVGNAAVIAEGIQVKIGGLGANSPAGVFPNWGAESGAHDWLYWVVPVHDTLGEGVPLPAGHALTNGSGRVSGTFPKIAGASSYKILKIDWDHNSYPRPYPEGTGTYLLTTVAQSSCATLTCSFTDNGTELTSYTNAGESLTTNVYMPRLDFWPGGIVLSPGQDISTAHYPVPALALQADVIGVGGVVTTQPAWAVAAEANSVMLSPATPPAAANIEALHTNGFGSFPGATILPGANLPALSPSGHKGRLNFGQHGQTNGFTPVITLGDSSWGKTWATPGHRPSADVNDLDLGYEGNIDTLYSRAQNEVREYVGKLPDGNPQEKLTASAKTFNIPVVINGNLTVTGKCAGCGANGSVASNPGPWSVSLTGQKAAIPPTNICGSSACGAGQYRVNYYVDSTAACQSPGKAATALTLGWKDEVGVRSLRLPLSGAGISADSSLGLGNTGNFGGGTVSVWSGGNAPITYATSYTGCSAGGGSYAIHITLEKMQ